MNSFHKFLLSVCTLVFPLKIYGRDNIPDGKAVFVCNHLSAVDIGIVSKAYKGKDMFFLAKKEVFKNKILSKIAVDFGAISIDRENPDIKSLMQASKALKEGHKLLIFPEGTRNKVETSLQPFKTGVALFAIKGQAKIVPIILQDRVRPFKTNYAIVGEPFELSEFYGKKFTDEVANEATKIIYDRMVELKNEVDQKVAEIKSKKVKKWNIFSKYLLA